MNFRYTLNFSCPFQFHPGRAFIRLNETGHKINHAVTKFPSTETQKKIVLVATKLVYHTATVGLSMLGRTNVGISIITNASGMKSSIHGA